MAAGGRRAAGSVSAQPASQQNRKKTPKKATLKSQTGELHQSVSQTASDATSTQQNNAVRKLGHWLAAGSTSWKIGGNGHG